MNSQNHRHRLQHYYRLHSPIYDATRWGFLFGRHKLLNSLPDLPPDPCILEVGCGTGHNIALLESTFPDAEITGMDLSKDMLKNAAQRLDKSSHVKLIHQTYGDSHLGSGSFDLILFSYSLSMMGKNPSIILQQTTNNLSSKGYLAVVDFNSSPFKWFQNWMQLNHVCLDGSLLPMLNKYFQPASTSVSNAYLGLWSYFTFIGKAS